MNSYHDIINLHKNEEDFFITSFLDLSPDIFLKKNPIYKNVIKTEFKDLYDHYLKYLDIDIDFNDFLKLVNKKQFKKFNILNIEFFNTLLRDNSSIYYIDTDTIYSKEPLIIKTKDLKVPYSTSLINYACFLDYKEYILYENNKLVYQKDIFLKYLFDMRVKEMKKLIRSEKISNLLN